MEYSFIGKRIPRVDAREKVTGEALYSTDFSVPGMLWGKIKRSPFPFARILSVNTDRAKNLPGVKVVITAKNVVQFPFLSGVEDELPLARDYARYAGDEVAAVAAIDEETAEEAVELIKVDYEELTPVLALEKAMDPGAPAVHPELKEIRQNIVLHIEFSRGEGEAAFQRADFVVEDRFRTQTVHQCYLEPQGCVAGWDSAGKLTVWIATQSQFSARKQLAKVLGIPEHRIRLIETYMGGGFGGKSGRQPQHFSAVCALLARAAGKPVKIALSRAEDFLAGCPRTSAIIGMRLGCKKDGAIIAKDVAITMDAGAYSGYTNSILGITASRMDSLYRIPNIKVNANLVYTNTVHRGAYRGLGGVQMIFALESMIDEVAEKLGMDPMEIRLKNCVQPGDITARGWVLNSCSLTESIQVAAKMAAWKKKPKGTDKCPHGLGMACQVWLSGNRDWHPLYDGSGAIVQMDQFGRVQILSGESELGQGSNTIFAQIAAEELGIFVEDVQVLPVDTDLSPFCLGTAASRVTVMGGNAVKQAAGEARNQLLHFAADILEARVDDLKIKDREIYVIGSPAKKIPVSEVAYAAMIQQGGVPITGHGKYRVPPEVVRSVNHYGNSSVAYIFSTQIAEVAVDVDTGKVEVLNIWDAEDIGKVLNPMACEGQIEGAILQGIGYCLHEEYVWKEGQLLNNHFTDYKAPVAPDVPRMHCAFIEKGNPGTPYGAKGVGEAAILPTAPAIGNAIYNAIGVRVNDLPITPEKVLQALRNKKAKKATKAR